MVEYKIGSVSKDYPEAVQELVNLSMEVAYHHDIIDETIDPSILEEMLCDNALKKFLGSGEMLWDGDEFVNLVDLATAHTQVNLLQDLGFIDSIEDENGNEVMWLTEKGVETINTIKNNVDDVRTTYN